MLGVAKFGARFSSPCADPSFDQCVGEYSNRVGTSDRCLLNIQLRNRCWIIALISSSQAAVQHVTAIAVD